MLASCAAKPPSDAARLCPPTASFHPSRAKYIAQSKTKMVTSTGHLRARRAGRAGGWGGRAGRRGRAWSEARASQAAVYQKHLSSACPQACCSSGGGCWWGAGRGVGRRVVGGLQDTPYPWPAPPWGQARIGNHAHAQARCGLQWECTLPPMPRAARGAPPAPCAPPIAHLLLDASLRNCASLSPSLKAPVRGACSSSMTCGPRSSPPLLEGRPEPSAASAGRSRGETAGTEGRRIRAYLP